VSRALARRAQASTATSDISISLLTASRKTVSHLLSASVVVCAWGYGADWVGKDLTDVTGVLLCSALDGRGGRKDREGAKGDGKQVGQHRITATRPHRQRRQKQVEFVEEQTDAFGLARTNGNKKRRAIDACRSRSTSMPQRFGRSCS